MNVKNNKRRKTSVKRIREVFFDLLKTKTLEEIKVSEICERAQINRSTFYNNFDGVYGLADVIYQDLNKEVLALFDHISDPNHCEEDFLNLFIHIRNNQELYKFCFKLEYEKRPQSAEKFFSYEHLAKERALYYRTAFFKSGFNAIVKLWLHNGCQESPEMMRDILLYEYRERIK